MGKTSNAAKQQWNEANYRQIKIMVPPKTAESFKTACGEAGQSMNGTLAKYMESYCRQRPHKTFPPLKITTRPQRRKSLELILDALNELRDAESSYLENIPENLRGGARHETSSQCIEMLDEAISILEGAF